MRHLLSLVALLIVTVGLLARPEGEIPKKVKPADLKVETLRKHVAAALVEPKRAADLKEFSAKLVLSADGIRYGKKGTKYVIRWELEPKAEVSLTATDVRLLKLGLEDWLSAVISQGGLVSDDESLSYLIVLGKRRLPTPTPVEPEVPQPQQPLVPKRIPTTPRMSVVYMWVITPTPCGSCAPATFDLVAMPMPVYPPAVWHGTWSAKDLNIENPPRMERAEDPEEVSLSLVSAGGVVLRRRALNTEGLSAADASRFYWRGYGMYWKRDYEQAARHFLTAAKLDAKDARTWYFLALSERALGQSSDAKKALTEAVKLQRKGLPRADVIGSALERVQGPSRLWIREALDRSETAPERVLAER